MSTPDILTPRVRSHLDSLTWAAQVLSEIVLERAARLEESLEAEFGSDALGPMSLGRELRKVRAAVADLYVPGKEYCGGAVGDLEAEVLATAVEDERRTQLREDERRSA
jgi:hypothetical protein